MCIYNEQQQVAHAGHAPGRPDARPVLAPPGVAAHTQKVKYYWACSGLDDCTLDRS